MGRSALVTCRDCVDQLSAYLDDDLPSRRARDIDIHLAGCADCRVYLQNLRATIDLARAAYAHEPAAEPRQRDAVTALKIDKE